MVFQNIKLIVPQFNSRELVRRLKALREREREQEKEENRNIEKHLTI